MAPAERINRCTRVIALKREQKPRVEMNPEPNQSSIGSGNSPPLTPYKCRGSIPLLFFFRATTTLVFVLKGLAVVASFVSSRGQFSQRKKVPSHTTPSRPSRLLETVHNSYPLPPPGDSCSPRFWGTTFHLACFFPIPPRFEGTKRNPHQIHIKPRLA